MAAEDLGHDNSDTNVNKPLPIRLLLLALAVICVQAEASAQKKLKLEKWQIDPYTNMEPKAMAKAGILNYGPFNFGNLAADPVTSTDIQKTLPFINIIWMETAHFRIGVELPEWSLPQDARTKKKVRAELTELKKKLPKIKPKSRKLAPWTRAHLTAHRLEKLYSDTQELFGVTDDDFPNDPTEVFPGPGKTYMGYGKYMGMRDKFLVLVINKGGPYRQYMEKYLGRPTFFAQRWHFTDSSSILFTCPVESNEFPLKHDTALHCALAFNVGQNLLDGFRYYSYNLPVWIREGFAHWNSRNISGKWPSFDQNEGSIADMKRIDKWKPYTKAMISGNKKFASFPEVAKWRDFGNLTFNDHVAIFSRIDYLMSMGPEKWRTFLFIVKGRVDEKWSINQKDLVGATREGLKKAYNLSFLSFDDKWKAWVKKNYASK
ncbi:MAG: hypothetical protein ACI89X_002266 [Planctomycetota bacterium]